MENVTDAVKAIQNVREVWDIPGPTNDLLADLDNLFTRHVFVRSDHLYGMTEVAQLFSIRAQTVSSWAKNPNAGFPLPVAYPSMGPVWDVVDVIKWWINWVPIKGKKVGILPGALIAKFSE